jgi:hypothetical protein
MDVNDGTDLAAMHQAITQTMAAAFPGVHVEFYRDEDPEGRRVLPLGDGVGANPPKAYVLLELSEMERGDSADPGTEQQPLMARFEAEVIVKSLQADAKVKVRVLAGSIAAYLRSRSRWPGVLNGSMRVTGCYKDDFSPDLDKFQVWRVEWVQEIWLGAGVWKETGTTPHALYSYVPLVGPGHEADYKPLEDVPHV